MKNVWSWMICVAVALILSGCDTPKEKKATEEGKDAAAVEATTEEAVEEKAEEVKEAVEEKAAEVKEAVEEKAAEVKEAVEEKAAEVEDSALDLLEDAPTEEK